MIDQQTLEEVYYEPSVKKKRGPPRQLTDEQRLERRRAAQRLYYKKNIRRTESLRAPRTDLSGMSEEEKAAHRKMVRDRAKDAMNKRHNGIKAQGMLPPKSVALDVPIERYVLDRMTRQEGGSVSTLIGYYRVGEGCFRAAIKRPRWS